MNANPAALASQLLEANGRLLKLRAELQVGRSLNQVSGNDRKGAQAEFLPGGNSPVNPTTPRLAQGIAILPKHLGWESQPVTEALRRCGQVIRENGGVAQSASQLNANPVDVAPVDVATRERPGINASAIAREPGTDGPKLFPDIGLGLLRREGASSGRLWLICRHLDREGRGALRIDNITQSLTTKSSDLYLCGKRQLRNLLRAGEGVYWTRDREQIWLRSAARVAAALGVERLTGRPVALPLSALLSGIGAFRAHLYAAFHSGRAKSEARRSAMPIARDTLAGLSGVGRTSQRTYEARVGTQALANFAIGEAATEGGQEERAWRQGQAVFTLQDYDGQQGRQGKTYLAWQLPNSYTGQHTLRPKGRQKRINRQLQDLVMKGMPGNEGDLVGRPAAGQPATAGLGPVVAAKRYYPNGRAAGQRRPKSGAEPAGPCYWRGQGVKNGRFALWHPLEKA